MRDKKTILITETDLIYCVAGQLFEQAPNREPRNVEKIMLEVRNKFRESTYNDNEWYSMYIEEDKLYKFVENLLLSIPEFVDLNLSYLEYSNGVKVDDESRPKFSFCSIYDVYNADSWKKDFIDLDAFVQNVHRALKIRSRSEDCFLCKYQEANDPICDACSVKKVNYFVYGIEFKGKYTLACQNTCYYGRYICCDECDLESTCEKRCDIKSENCDIVIKKEKGVD